MKKQYLLQDIVYNNFVYDSIIMLVGIKVPAFSTRENFYEKGLYRDNGLSNE